MANGLAANTPKMTHSPKNESGETQCRCTPGNYADDCPKHGSGVNIVGAETPRTDEKAKRILEDFGPANNVRYNLLADFARTLEKELNEAKAELKSVCCIGNRMNAELSHTGAENTTLRAALAAAEKARDEVKTLLYAQVDLAAHELRVNDALSSQLDTATAALEETRRHMDYCRSLVNAPDNDVLAELIKELQAALVAMTARAESAEAALASYRTHTL